MVAGWVDRQAAKNVVSAAQIPTVRRAVATLLRRFGTGGKSGLVISLAVGGWFRGEWPAITLPLGTPRAVPAGSHLASNRLQCVG